MSPPRVFLDSCVLIEGLVAPWSASRGLLILGRSSLFAFVLAAIVIEETERVLISRLADRYGGGRRLKEDFDLLLARLHIERVSHASRQQVKEAQKWIRHRNDAPVLAAAVLAKPDWLVTDNTHHFSSSVALRTGLRIVTPVELLEAAGRGFAG